MNNKTLFNNLFLYSVLGIFITVAACSNSVTGGEDEHSEPEGFRLKLSGQTIVEQLPDEALTGGITVEAGEETALISIFFINHDGEEFQPDGEEETLGYEFAASGIAESEQHSEDGKWSFHVHGETEGNTTLQLMIMHDGHSDFESLPIPITVTAAAKNN
ncbi:MAG: hypothetical protein JJ895_07800 [Balneolaceae bacterium]|nr:hypothetical protein [Balneolaceae bacterium]